MTALLAATLLATTPHSSDEETRLAAANAVIDLARQTETICKPMFRTTTPSSVRVIPGLPVVAGWATPRTVGGFFVSHGNLSGFVDDKSVVVLFGLGTDLDNRRGERFPLDARLWTEEECVANARSIATLTMPE